MAYSDATFIQQNPWWSDPEHWQVNDPHLRRLAEQPARLPSEAVNSIPLDRAAIHVLRGPRQVGKSTDLKLLVDLALREGFTPRRVRYLSLDLLQGAPPAAVVETLSALQRVSGTEQPGLLLLDEVTAVRDWQVAVKYAWDAGLIDREIVVCTGSTASDLRRGVAERLPGRRGKGRDILILPRSFAAFARVADTAIPPSPGLAVTRFADPEHRPMLEEMRVFLPRLDRLLATYSAFGGLPAAIAEAVSGATEPSEPTKRIIYDSLVREAARRRASEPAVGALLERMVRSLGSKTNWSRLAREMAVPIGLARSRSGLSRGATAREYVEFLAASYFILIVYFWKPDSDSSSLARDKKLYFGDPLLRTVALDHAPGLTADMPTLVENLVAVALYRSCEPLGRQAETWASPECLHVWETGSGGEIDFVCGRRPDLAAVEVKFQADPDLRKAGAMTRAFPGRPIVFVTRDRLDFRDKYTLTPASLLLWAVG